MFVNAANKGVAAGRFRIPERNQKQNFLQLCGAKAPIETCMFSVIFVSSYALLT